MPSNQANFNLHIGTTADLKGINELKTALEQVKKAASNPDLALSTKEILDASKAANTLEQAMTRAYDVKLNTINISQFNKYLKESGMSLKDIQQGLSTTGVVGQQAFMKAANSLMTMNTAMKQSSGFLDRMAKSISNTVRYQVLNSAFRSITGSISEAYGYVKNLDKSLNAIQIVTEKSADSMKEFAKEANNAAQSLGAKTTDYTDASLIYYQQGLDDEAVAGRTDTTIKMANVLGESASEVSDYMTAIWNNFDDGSKSLEYFGDVITNLGANTASSAAEIAEGLGKFAAVADTVGLSYEYATAALATVVAETRQSADTVGTAFKTLFARIQDLELGDEGSVSLGKYAQALEKVGINILDATGNMKNMDELLDEMGSKWNSLSQAQQTALAQNVAGTRQYTQLVALMENWDEVRENIDLATESTGTLETKQNIYMQSTAAHLKTMKAAWENFFDSMLQTDTINDLADASTNIANVLANVADSVGGLIPILSMLGATGMRVFSTQISTGIASVIDKITLAKDTALVFEDNLRQVQKEFGSGSWAMSNDSQLSDSNKQILSDMVTEYKKIQEAKQIANKQDYEAYENIQKNRIQLGELNDSLSEEITIWKSINNNLHIFKTDLKDINDFEGFQKLKIEFEQMNSIIPSLKESISTLENEMLKLGTVDDEIEVGQILVNIAQSLEADTNGAIKASDSMQEFSRILNQPVQPGNYVEATKEQLNSLVALLSKKYDLVIDAGNLLSLKNEIEVTSQSIKVASETLEKSFDTRLIIKNISDTIGALGQLAMSINNLRRIGSIWTNDDLSLGEKIFQTITNLTMALPMLISGYEKLSISLKAFKTTEAELTKASTLATQAETLAIEANTKAVIANNAVKAAKEKASIAQAAFDNAKNAVTNAWIEGDDVNFDELKNNYLKAQNELKKANTALENANTAAKLANTQAEEANVASITATNNVEKLRNKNLLTLIKNLGAKLKLQLEEKAALLASHPLLLATAAAVAGVAIAYKAYKKSLEDTAKEDKLELKRLSEKRKEYEDTKSNLDKLTEAYDSLLKQQSEGTISNKEMKDQVYDLCMQYGLEELAIKSLSDSYKDLKSDIEAVKDANNEELKRSSEESKKGAVRSARSNVKASLNERNIDNWGRTIDFENLAHTFSDTSQGQFKSELESILKEDLDIFGRVSTDTVIKAAMVNREALQDLADKYDIAASETLQAILDATEEQYNEYSNATKSGIDANTELEYKDINNLSDYNAAVENITQQYLNEGVYTDEDKARAAAINSLNAISEEYRQFGKKQSLIDILFENSDGSEKAKEKIVKFVKDLKDDELAAIAGNFNLFQALVGTSEDFNDAKNKFTTRFQSLIDYAKENTLSGLLSDALTSEDALTKEDINNLFNNDFGKAISYKVGSKNVNVPSISQEEFSGLSYDAQKVKMLEYYTAVQMASEETRQKVVKNLQEEKEERDKQYYQDLGVKDGDAANRKVKAAQEDLEQAKNQFNKEEILKDLGLEKPLTEEDIVEYLLGDFNPNSAEKLIQEKLKGLINDKNPEKVAKIVKVSKDYNEVNQELVNSIDKLKDSTYDYESAAKSLEEQLSGFNKKLDTLQSSYKTLFNAVEEYNKNQYLTVDSYQALMNLEPQYLACLVDETGQINLNKDALKEATIAQYQKIAADKLAQLQNDLNAISLGKMTLEQAKEKWEVEQATLANWDNVDSIIAQVNSLEKAGKIAEGTAESMRKYAQAVRASTNAAIEGINKDFDGAMGTTKKKSEKEKKDVKKYDDEFDRYHDLKKSIDALADAMSDLDKRQSHLFGKELAASLKQSNQLIQQQRSNYEALASAQRAEMGEIQGDLGAMGVAFDSTTGQITNYAEATTRALAELNAAIETFNNSAQTAADKKLLEAAEKNYEEFKKKLERYDNLVEQVRDTENKLDDLWYKEKENNLKAWEAVIEVSLDLEEAEREWQKFVNEMNTDFKGVFKDIKGEMKTLADEVSHLIKPGGTLDINENAMSDIEREIDKMMAGGESDMFVSVSEAQEKLKEYMSAYQDNVESIFEAYKQGWEDYVDGIDQAIGKFDDLIKQYEKLNDELDHQNKLIELLYGDEAYDYLNSLYDAQANNLLGEMNSLSTQVKFYEQMFHDASEKWGADSQAANEWKEAWENALSELHDKEEEYLQDIQNLAINMVNKIADELGKKLTGGMGLNKAREQWDDAMAAADGYYDEVQRIYQLETLQGKYQDLINNTSNVSDQQKIKAIMDDQLATLGNKNKLSEVDIELAEKRLQVLQAQIDLENAQNNKNSMKVTRGADGNWSYQYVADEGDVADKQQNLLDKLNEWRTAAKEAYLEFTELGLSLEEQYVERFTEISQDLTLTDEERQAKLEYLYEYYYGDNGVITAAMQESNYLERELNQATAEELWGLYQADADKFTERNDKEKELIEQLTEYGIDNYLDLYNVVTECYDEIKDKCNEVNEESVEGWTSAAAEMARVWNSDDGDSVRTAVKNAITECQKVLEDYSARVDAGSEAAQEDLRDVEGAINRVEEATDSLRGATNELINETLSELTEYENYLRQLEQAWYKVKDRAVDAMNTAIEYLRKTAQEAINTINAITQAKIAAANAVAAAQRTAVDTKLKTNPDPPKTVVHQYDMKANGDVYDRGKYVGNRITGTFKGFKTGGYTGTWTSASTGMYTGNWHGDGISSMDDGKLAVLHQKELVLNASDTKNILSVVDIVRQISSGLRDRLSSLGSLFAGGGAPGGIVNNNDAGNVFNITAEFPNANDVDEIREAILSLPNLASQYLGR